MFGNKDKDGFYRAEIRDRVGLIPCNMVSEIQTEDDEMMGQLLKQGFLPLNTPVEKLDEMFSLVCLYDLCVVGQLNAVLTHSTVLNFLLNCVFLLSCEVNCDRFKDGRSINRRSRKSKRGPCSVRRSSALCFILFHSLLFISKLVRFTKFSLSTNMRSHCI